MDSVIWEPFEFNPCLFSCVIIQQGGLAGIIAGHAMFSSQAGFAPLVSGAIPRRNTAWAISWQRLIIFYFEGVFAMKGSKGLGLLLLGVWLVATGITRIIHLNFLGMTTLLGVGATVAGVLIILGL